MTMARGRVLDAGALKALAHPLRVRILELLVEVGPSTASSLGRMLEENSGSTSYHLRQLAKHGLIEEATDLGTGRDRFWQAVEGGWTLEGREMLEREDTAAAAQLVLDEINRHRQDRLARWHREATAWDDDWIAATIEMTARLRLTRDDVAAMRDELVAVVDRYRERQVEAGTADSALTTVQLDVFPSEAPPSET